MQNRTLLKTALAGTLITAVCCATPVLVILLLSLGLSAWTGVLDYVLVPALAGFAAFALYAWHRERRQGRCCEFSGENQIQTARGQR